MKLIKNNQEAYMGWHDGRPIWDSNRGASISEPFYTKAYDKTVWIRIYKGEQAPAITIEYSRDGKVWQTLGTTSTTTLSIDIPAKSKVWFRAKTNAWAALGEKWVEGHTISGVNPCEIGGNIMSLLYGDDFTGAEREFPDTSTHVFSSLFYGGYGSEVVDASKLILPAITLNDYCYSSMFRGCTNLIQAPVLPDAILAQKCYPTMFSGCSSLSNIKCLVTSPSETNFKNWVYGVAATGTFTKKAGIVWPTGADGIPEGWTVVEE